TGLRCGRHPKWSRHDGGTGLRCLALPPCSAAPAQRRNGKRRAGVPTRLSTTAPGRSALRRDNADGLATTAGAELHRARRQREHRVVATAPDVHPGVEVGAVLPHQDLSGVHQLAAEPLDAETLRVRVAAVLGAGRALLVCHPGCLLPALD